MKVNNVAVKKGRGFVVQVENEATFDAKYIFVEEME